MSDTLHLLGRFEESLDVAEQGSSSPGRPASSAPRARSSPSTRSTRCSHSASGTRPTSSSRARSSWIRRWCSASTSGAPRCARRCGAATREARLAHVRAVVGAGDSSWPSSRTRPAPASPTTSRDVAPRARRPARSMAKVLRPRSSSPGSHRPGWELPRSRRPPRERSRRRPRGGRTTHPASPTRRRTLRDLRLARRVADAAASGRPFVDAELCGRRAPAPTSPRGCAARERGGCARRSRCSRAC